jgi:hypothetical protein
VNAVVVGDGDGDEKPPPRAWKDVLGQHRGDADHAVLISVAVAVAVADNVNVHVECCGWGLW